MFKGFTSFGHLKAKEDFFNKIFDKDYTERL